MAGHSRWAKVKHFKGAIDAKRAKIFSKLAKKTTVSAKQVKDLYWNEEFPGTL